MNKKIISYVLLLLGFLILVFFISSIDFDLFVAGIKLAGVKVVFLVLLLTFLNILVKALKWKLLVGKIAKKSISMWFSFLSIFAGLSSGSIFPGRTEITKPLMLKKTYGCNLSQTVPSVLVEKIFDFLGLIAVFFIALFIVGEKSYNYGIYVLPFVVVFVLGLIFLLFFSRTMSRIVMYFVNKLPFKKKNETREFVESFFQSFKVLKAKKLSSFIFILSFSSMAIDVLRLFYLLTVLGIFADVSVIALGSAGGLLFGVLTLIPGGVGVTEVSSSMIIGSLSGISVKTAILLDRIFGYYFVIVVGGLVLLFYGKLMRK